MSKHLVYAHPVHSTKLCLPVGVLCFTCDSPACPSFLPVPFFLTLQPIPLTPPTTTSGCSRMASALKRPQPSQTLASQILGTQGVCMRIHTFATEGLVARTGAVLPHKYTVVVNQDHCRYSHFIVKWGTARCWWLGQTQK